MVFLSSLNFTNIKYLNIIKDKVNMITCHLQKTLTGNYITSFNPYLASFFDHIKRRFTALYYILDTCHVWSGENILKMSYAEIVMLKAGALKSV